MCAGAGGGEISKNEAGNAARSRLHYKRLAKIRPLHFSPDGGIVFPAGNAVNTVQKRREP